MSNVISFKNQQPPNNGKPMRGKGVTLYYKGQAMVTDNQTPDDVKFIHLVKHLVSEFGKEPA